MRSDNGPIGVDRADRGQYGLKKCRKQKVSELVCLVGKTLVEYVGALCTTQRLPIAHMEQKSENPTIN